MGAIGQEVGNLSKKKHSLFKVFNVQSTVFVPIWRRVFVVTGTALWAIVEFVNGGLLWAFLFGAVAIYCAHQFFIVFDPVDEKE